MKKILWSVSWSFAVLAVAMLFASDALAKSKHRTPRTVGKLVILSDDILIPHETLNEEDSFEAQMKQSVARAHSFPMDVKVMAQKGATTISAIGMVPLVLAEKPDMVIVAIGYNDALARNDPDVVYNNLDSLLKELERAGAYIVLVGIEAPVWMDHAYTTHFNSIYPKISQRFRVVYHNGFLKGVQGNLELTFEDLYTPNRMGIAKIVQNIVPTLEPLVQMLRRVQRCTDNPNAYRCEEYIQKVE